MVTTQLAGPIDLLKGSWEILQARWKTFVVIQILPMLALIPLGVVAAILVGSTILPIYKVTSTDLSLVDLDFSKYKGILNTLLPFMIVGILISVVVQLWAGVALIFAIKDRKEGIGFKESYRRAWRVLRSYLWVSLLVGLAVLGGLLLLVIPGIIFGVWFAFAGYIVVDQSTRGTAALKASKALVKGRFWAVVWRILVIGVLGLILVSVGEALDKSWEKTPMAWVGGVGTMVVSLLWSAFAGAYVWLLYKSLKESKGS